MKIRIINVQNLPKLQSKNNSNINNISENIRNLKVQDKDLNELDQLIYLITQCLSSSTTLLSYDVLKKCLAKFKKMKEKVLSLNCNSSSIQKKLKYSNRLQSINNQFPDQSESKKSKNKINKQKYTHSVYKIKRIHKKYYGKKLEDSSLIESGQMTNSRFLEEDQQNRQNLTRISESEVIVRLKASIEYSKRQIEQLKKQINQLNLKIKDLNQKYQIAQFQLDKQAYQKIPIQILYHINIYTDNQSQNLLKQQNNNLKMQIQKLQQDQIYLWMQLNSQIYTF